jgi:lysyl-tRNA synthetase class 1
MRTNQIPFDIKKTDEENIKQRIDNVRYWLKNFAPNKLKFEIKKSLPKVKLSAIQKSIIKGLIEKFEGIEWDANRIHNEIYKMSEEQDIPIKTTFETIYQLILDQNEGPRAGYFLSNLDKEFIMKRFNEAI